jgi:hypothetical protein
LVTTALSKRLARDSVSRYALYIPSFRKLPLIREFSHPLARAARVWAAQQHDGSEQRVLVIVTTMELDPANKRFNKKLVEKLSRAAREYLALSSVASAYIIMNPMRQWRR